MRDRASMYGFHAFAIVAVCLCLYVPLAQATEEELAGDDDASEWGERESLYRGLTDDDFAKSIPMFGSDWRFSFGGYVKLDVIGDFSGTGDPYQFITATIPVEGTSGPQPGSYAQIHAKESRFAFEVRNYAEGLPANRAFIELDFFDESTSGPRLRQAYLQWGNLTAGQTWTTLTELRQLPFLIDFAYGDALYGGRTAQLRWEQSSGDRFDWAVAVEDWSDEAIANVDDQPGIARSNFPLLALRGTQDFGGGLVTLGGSLAQLRWDGSGSTSDATALQWALVVGGRIYLDGGQRHYVGFGGSYGDGSSQNIISLAEGGTANAVLLTDGTLETQPAWNSQLALHYEWSEAFSSTFSLAAARIDPSELIGASDLERTYAGHINLIWQNHQIFQTGIEYMYGERENVNGDSGSASRIQLMTMFSF